MQGMVQRIITPPEFFPSETARLAAIRENVSEWRKVKPGDVIATQAEDTMTTQYVGEVKSIELDELAPGRYSISIRFTRYVAIYSGHDESDNWYDGDSFTYMCTDGAKYVMIEAALDEDSEPPVGGTGEISEIEAMRRDGEITWREYESMIGYAMLGRQLNSSETVSLSKAGDKA